VEADADCEQRYTASMTGACSAEARALAECKVMTSNWVCFDELSPYAPYVYAPECADRYSANAACDEG